MSDSAPTRLNVDLAQVRELAELLDRTGLTEIEVHDGERAVRVARQAAATAAPAPPAPPPAGAAAAPAPAAGPAADDWSAHPGLVRAPLVGTAYLSPEPGTPPFAPEGAQVAEGDTLMIIEAMKVLNPIPAPREGRVMRVMVGNESPVEYDQPLVVIE